MRKVLLKTVLVIGSAISVLALAPSVKAPMIQDWVATGKPIKSWVVTASWYGPGFDGQPTASGQLYNENAPTAAHPSLPLGSLIRVTNPRTGQSQIARINDRGPYSGDRELDVSYMVASRVGLLEPGVADVRIELLEQPRRHSIP
jgi:rare lipoprotein A (peptidoglycan hydrolase)